MNKKTTKFLWNAGIRIALYSTIFWIIETAYFIIRYGWHLSAINHAEFICDTIVSAGWIFSACLIMIVTFCIIDNTINQKRV